MPIIEWCAHCGGMVHPEIRTHKARIRWHCSNCRGRDVAVDEEEVAPDLAARHAAARSEAIDRALSGRPRATVTRHTFWEQS